MAALQAIADEESTDEETSHNEVDGSGDQSLDGELDDDGSEMDEVNEDNTVELVKLPAGVFVFSVQGSPLKSYTSDSF